jgi:hypothetical protein
MERLSFLAGKIQQNERRVIRCNILSAVANQRPFVHQFDIVVGRVVSKYYIDPVNVVLIEQSVSDGGDILVTRVSFQIRTTDAMRQSEYADYVGNCCCRTVETGIAIGANTFRNERRIYQQGEGGRIMGCTEEYNEFKGTISS